VDPPEVDGGADLSSGGNAVQREPPPDNRPDEAVAAETLPPGLREPKKEHSARRLTNVPAGLCGMPQTPTRPKILSTARRAEERSGPEPVRTGR
jgi:hypothetical protein